MQLLSVYLKTYHRYIPFDVENLKYDLHNIKSVHDELVINCELSRLVQETLMKDMENMHDSLTKIGKLKQ